MLSQQTHTQTNQTKEGPKRSNVKERVCLVQVRPYPISYHIHRKLRSERSPAIFHSVLQEAPPTLASHRIQAVRSLCILRSDLSCEVAVSNSPFLLCSCASSSWVVCTELRRAEQLCCKLCTWSCVRKTISVRQHMTWYNIGREKLQPGITERNGTCLGVPAQISADHGFLLWVPANRAS